MVCPNTKNGVFCEEKAFLKKSFLMFAAVSILAVGCNRQADSPAVPTTQNYNYSHSLQIGNVNLMVEIAATPAQMEQGLSDRNSMDENQGMLFDFGQQPSGTPFWMKDMKFDLDIIWVKDGKIVQISPQVSHELGSRNIISSAEAVDKVLEINAGVSEKLGLEVGDEIR